MTRVQGYADAMFHHKLVCQAHAYTNASELPILPHPSRLPSLTLARPQRSSSRRRGAASTTGSTRSSRGR